MLRMLSILVAALLLVTGCATGGNSEDENIDPVTLLETAGDRLIEQGTFRLEVRHSGADYNFGADLPDNPSEVTLTFRRALAQYVAPNVIQATVRVLLAGLAVDVDVFSVGTRQWFRLASTGWINQDFAEGFDPERIIAEDTGFQAALNSLREVEYIGTTTLDDGQRVYHLTGITAGEDVSALLVGLIEATGVVPVDVYIQQDTGLPARVVITQTDIDPANPTIWTIDVYNIGDDPEIDPPAELTDTFGND